MEYIQREAFVEIQTLSLLIDKTVKEGTAMKRAGIVTKVLVFAVIAFLIWQIIDNHRDIVDANAYLDEQRAQVAALEVENDEMRRRIDSSDTDETIEEIARDQLDLVKPGEEVIEVIN